MPAFRSAIAPLGRVTALTALLALPATLLAQPLCAPGSFSATGRQPCTLATPGHYVAIAGAKEQRTASAGYYVPGSGATAQIAALPGSYVPTTGATQPTLAPAGTYVPAAAATKAISAPVGYFAPNAGMTAPIAAGLGFFVPRDRRVAPTAASPGHYVGTTAAAAETLCPLHTNAYGQAPACRFTGGTSIPMVPGSIGPRFTASFTPGATIDLGDLALGSTITLYSWIRNASSDLQQRLGGTPQPSQVLALTQLSLLGAAAPAVPQVTTALPGLPAGTVLGEGAMQTFAIAITGVRTGAFSQMVTFATDQTADVGTPGQTFQVAFRGTVTPEPSTISLFGLGGALVLGAAARRRRRQR